LAAAVDKDAFKLDDKERARWRAQAIAWLRADYTAYEKQLQRGTRQDWISLHECLKDWQRDADLATIRNEKALAQLSMEERERCRQLWADVAALLDKARDKLR